MAKDKINFLVALMCSATLMGKEPLSCAKENIFVKKTPYTQPIPHQMYQEYGQVLDDIDDEIIDESALQVYKAFVRPALQEDSIIRAGYETYATFWNRFGYDAHNQIDINIRAAMIDYYFITGIILPFINTIESRFPWYAQELKNIKNNINALKNEIKKVIEFIHQVSFELDNYDTLIDAYNFIQNATMLTESSVRSLPLFNINILRANVLPVIFTEPGATD